MDGEAPSPAQGAGPTTTTGFPIAPVYAGASNIYNFAPALRTRKKEFFSEQFYKTPDFGTDFSSPYVPRPVGPRGGIDIQRHMAGVGVPYADPLDNFKPGRLEIDKKRQGVKRPSRPLDSSRMRRRGTSAYRRINKDNVDYGEQMYG